jgi:hypothetical protein
LFFNFVIKASLIEAQKFMNEFIKFGVFKIRSKLKSSLEHQHISNENENQSNSVLTRLEYTDEVLVKRLKLDSSNLKEKFVSIGFELLTKIIFLSLLDLNGD